jgi:hypothetical protein
VLVLLNCCPHTAVGAINYEDHIHVKIENIIFDDMKCVNYSHDFICLLSCIDHYRDCNVIDVGDFVVRYYDCCGFWIGR